MAFKSKKFNIKPPKEKLKIVIGAAEPRFARLAPRRRRRRNVFGLIQEYSTNIKLSDFFPIDSAVRSAAALVGQIPESRLLVQLRNQIRTYFERN